jgi:4-amino-4-deoxy-L-arabinose transferase-like glycosyltransferase
MVPKIRIRITIKIRIEHGGMDSLKSPSGGSAKFLAWIAAHPRWTLTLAVVIALGPFLAKPFNMDDPLFVWTARQIQAHPGNPYGFDVNWYGGMQPMWSIMQNPPLASYYLALAARILGWNEISLHLALLLPALAAILGTHRLARHFCDHPLLAALATLFTPVFLVSSTTVMCDVLMLAFWVWAVALWVEGTERRSFWPLIGSAFLVTLAALTKYFGACLIPLLAVYSLASKRGFSSWTICLLIPLLGLCAYQWAAEILYQHNLLWKAAGYAAQQGGLLAGAKTDSSMIALAFTGGGLASAFFLAPWWQWRARTLLGLAGGAALMDFALFRKASFVQAYSWIQGNPRASMEAQFVFWTICGIFLLALLVADVWKRRDAGSWLLALWVFGTFLFTALFNWTVNGRSILPMAPAVGILLARGLQPRMITSRILIPLAASALFALLVTRADYLLAVASRDSAFETCQRYGQSGGTLWFEGHWGFQYYLRPLGALPLEVHNPGFHPGDVLAVPLNNTNLNPPGKPRNGFSVVGPRYLSDMNLYIGAGFYSSSEGPLPFIFGRVPPENVAIFVAQPAPSS